MNLDLEAVIERVKEKGVDESWLKGEIDTLPAIEIKDFSIEERQSWSPQDTETEFLHMYQDLTGINVEKDALERGMEMMTKPLSSLPYAARDYAQHMCKEIGMCMEVLLTAWCHCAEVVEGYKRSEDAAYQATTEAFRFFGKTVG